MTVFPSRLQYALALVGMREILRELPAAANVVHAECVSFARAWYEASRWAGSRTAPEDWPWLAAALEGRGGALDPAVRCTACQERHWKRPVSAPGAS